MKIIPYDRYYIPEGVTSEQIGCALILPHVPDMLRDETMAAAIASSAPYFAFPLDPQQPYQYAQLFAQLWEWPVDTVWIEQDMVPTTEQIKDLLYCEHEWCTIKYHQGGGMYTDGIGFAKFARSLKQSWPDAGTNIAADPRGLAPAVAWPSLNESVENHLSRLGIRMHVHRGHVTHLHYPEPDHG